MRRGEKIRIGENEKAKRKLKKKTAKSLM